MFRQQAITCWALAAVLAAVPTAETRGQDGPYSVMLSGGDVGIGQFGPEVWGVTTLTAENRTSEPVELLGTVFCEDAKSVQFARPVWLPPRTRHKVWLPVRPPQRLAEPRQVDSTAMLLDPAASEEVSLAGARSLFLVDRRPLRTGVLSGGDDEVVDLAVALRGASGHEARLSVLRAGGLPPVALGYDGLDGMILAGADLRLDPAQAWALRRWVVGGGRLWVVLDRLAPAAAEQVLDADWSLHLVDRVELSDFTLEGPGGGTRIEVERPIEMLRVLAPGWEVVHRVNGWPASLRRNVGQGVAVVSTLGVRAWVQAGRVPQALPPLEPLAQDFNRARSVSPVATVRWDGFLRQQIGYRIVGRNEVLVVLSVFCVALLACGAVLWRLGRLEHIGWLGAGLAVLAASGVLGLGLSRRQATPQTLSEAAAVQLVPEQGVGLIHGQAMVYTHEGPRTRLECGSDMALWPELNEAVQGSTSARLVWLDVDRWEWRNIRFPGGKAWAAAFAGVQGLPGAAAAELTFNAEGAAISFRGGLEGELSDVLLATAAGRAAPQRTGANTWRVGAQDVLGPGEYVATTAAGEREAQRRDVYRALFEHGEPIARDVTPRAPEPAPAGPAPKAAAKGAKAPKQPRKGDAGAGPPLVRAVPPPEDAVGPRPGSWAQRLEQPILLGWTDAMPLGLDVPGTARKVNWKLLMTPLTLRRPAAQTPVRIPSLFVPWEVQRGRERPDDRTGGRPGVPPLARLSTAYDPRTGEWLKMTTGGTVDLAFHVPRELLPWQAESARLTLDLRAPGRSVRVLVRQGEQWVAAHSVEGPAASQEIAIPVEALGPVGAGGRLEVSLEIGETPSLEALGQPWQVRRLGLEVRGVVLER